MYRVLIVEDDAALRFIYPSMKTWSECGFSIAHMASNGKDALDILGKQSFDLIFSDIRMPFVDGVELLKTLSESGNTTPFIFASSYSDFEYARQGLVYGAFDYIIKPVEEKKLSEVLLRLKKKLEEDAPDNKILPVISEGFGQLGIDIETNNFAKQAAVYFSQNYGKVYSADDIAADFGYSKDHFAKLFKQNFGVSYHDVSTRLKIAYAIDLIGTGNYKMYEISDILGFSSVDYFTKVFKDITGSSPSKYK